MKTSCMIFLPVAVHGARYGLLRVGTGSASVTDQPQETAQRSLYEEDFQAFFRGLLGAPLNTGMSMGASAGLSLSMMPTAGLSMPLGLSGGMSMSMSGLALDSGDSSADPTSSNDGDILDLVSTTPDMSTSDPETQGAAEEETEDNLPLDTTSDTTSTTTITTPTGDVAQTTGDTSTLPNGTEGKSSKTTAAVVGALSVAGVALLAGVVIRKKMAHGNSDASVGDNSLPNSVL